MVRTTILIVLFQSLIACYQGSSRKGSPYDGKGIQAGGNGTTGGSPAGTSGSGGDGGNSHGCNTLGPGFFFDAESGKCMQLNNPKTGEQICATKDSRAKFNSETQTCDVINEQSTKTAVQDCTSVTGQTFDSATNKCMKGDQEVVTFCAILHGEGWVLDKSLGRCVDKTSYDILALCQDQNDDQVCDYDPTTRQFGRGKNAKDPPIDCGFECGSSSGGAGGGSGGSGGNEGSNNLAPNATLGSELSFGSAVVRHEDVSCIPPVVAIRAGEKGIQITCLSPVDSKQTVAFKAGSVAGLEQTAANTRCKNNTNYVAGATVGTPFDLKLVCSDPQEMATNIARASEKLVKDPEASAIQADSNRLGAYLLHNIEPYPLHSNDKSVADKDLTSPRTMDCDKAGSVMMFQGFRVGFTSDGKVASVAPYCLPPLYFMKKFSEN